VFSSARRPQAGTRLAYTHRARQPTRGLRSRAAGARLRAAAAGLLLRETPPTRTPSPPDTVSEVQRARSARRASAAVFARLLPPLKARECRALLGALRARRRKDWDEQIARVSAREALLGSTVLALIPVGSRTDRGVGDVLA
jgi:hypothetical protein